MKTKPIPETVVESTRQMLRLLQPDIIFLPTNWSYVRVFIADISYIEASSNYAKINTSSGQHLVLITMKELMLRLPEDKFCRINNSYIVNIGWILEYDKEGILLANGKQLSFGKNGKREFKRKVSEL